MPEPERRLVHKPRWLIELEAALARAIPVHPHLLSAAKLLVLTPLFYLGLSKTVPELSSPWVLLPAFAVFAALDYLDGVVARGRGLESGFGRVFDRATDYPVLLLFAAYAYASVPRLPLALKLGFDVLLLVLFLLGRGSTENRLRTTLSYTALVGLLFVSRGWLPEVFTVHLVSGLLWLGAGFSALVALYNLRILQKRFIADGLSALNLACGVWSIALASQGQFVASLVLLIVGAAFDGFDGAAARRWGGTRFGVYSDDIADGVNYGIAPGAAVFFAVGDWEGAIIGAAYSVFTLGRLVFFTLNKTGSDPNYFAGVPSTSGGLITLCSVILFRESPLILGVLVGVAVSLMVSFSSQYRHPGRAAGKHPRRAALLVPLGLGAVLAGAKFGGAEGAAALILGLNLVYGFWPVVRSFRRVLSRCRDTPPRPALDTPA
jgi:CDP-diacylglycerol--serine O-phosphatidyltransferase